jgi:hypothetical protein
VDINLKIAKLLTNAMNWKIDFNAFKGSKYSFSFPMQADFSGIRANPLIEIEDVSQ